MGELDLDAIKARADAATRGPWLAFGDTLASFGGAHNCAGGIPESGYVHEAYCGYEPMVFRLAHADAEFIAHARTDVPALLARVAELEAERDDALDALTKAMDHNDEICMAIAELDAAEARGRQWAIDALRDREAWAKWCAQRIIADGMQTIDIRQPIDAADYLAAHPDHNGG